MIRDWLARRRDDDDFRVWCALDDEPGAGGWDIRKRTGMRTGRVYPALARLEARGWITSFWELPEPPDRPRRRLYRRVVT